MQTKWKTVPEAPNYEVSNKGVVRRIRDKHVMRGFYTLEGYHCINLTVRPPGANKSKTVSRYVHRLVAFAFIGNPPDDINTWQVDHKDDNPHNNDVRNLQWMIAGDNARKASRQRGPGRRLRPERRAVLVKRIAEGVLTTAELCAEFGVTPTTIRSIRHGRTKDGLDIQRSWGGAGTVRKR